MVIFDRVELLADHYPYKCRVITFEYLKMGNRFIKNVNHGETRHFAESCSDFELVSTYNQKNSGIWVYILRAPYKYRDISSIANILPKWQTSKRHYSPKPVDYDDLVAEECGE